MSAALNCSLLQLAERELLGRPGTATRKDLDRLLQAKISDALDDQQKRNLITNLLQEMRRDKIAVVHGRGPDATWELYKPPEKDDG